MGRATAGTLLDDAIYPNGVTTAYSYDNLNRLTNLAATHVPSSTPITNFGYQYDAAGNRTQKSTLDYTEDYGYDPLYRLTRTDRTNPGATPPNQWTWNYDAVGNRTSAQKDSEATTSSYNEKNQLTGATGGGKMLWRGTLDEPGIATFSAPTINGQPARMLAGNVFEATLDLPAGANNVTIQAQDGSGNVATKVYSVNVIGVPSSYTYDANGNLSAKTEGSDSWTYTWNALNQLTAASKNAVTQAIYSFDPLGRRVERSAPGTLTKWTYDDENILRVSETAGAGTVLSTAIHGLDIDEPLASETGGALSYLHSDALGSVSSTTNGSGILTGSRTYDAWGNVQAGSLAGERGFTGREWDPGANLWYYRSRMYSSEAGRFVSEDPIGLNGGSNLYSYVTSRPTRFRDPSGEFLFVAPVIPAVIYKIVAIVGAAAVVSELWPAHEVPPAAVPVPKPTPRPHPWNREPPQPPTPTCTPTPDPEDCKAKWDDDIARCKQFNSPFMRGECIRNANNRYAACISGGPMPPYYPVQ